MTSFTDQVLTSARQIALETSRRETTHLKWATVTATSPVRIRYDGETTASIVPPQTTAAGLNVGDRVQIMKQHGQAVIVGPAGGHRAISDGTNFLQVGEDGAGPRLWASTDVFREYNLPANMYVTGAGTIGTSTIPGLRGVTGALNITPSGANVPTSAVVTLPSGRFTDTPSPWATAASSVVGTTVTGVGVASASTTSMTIWLTRTNTTTTYVYWGAVQA